MGIVILGALTLYLIVLVTVTWLAYRWATKRGLPRGKRWLTASGGFLLVYLPVFWDHIPTIMAHKYYCEKEAGFWVYKTLDQWRTENPGVAETLKSLSGAGSRDSRDGYAYETYSLNERIVWHHKISKTFLGVRQYEEILQDAKNDEIVAKEIYFQSGRCSGPPSRISDLKFWLNQCECRNSKEPFSNGQGLSWSKAYDQFSKMGAK